MKIALGQLKIFWEDKKANMEKLKICLKQLIRNVDRSFTYCRK